MAKHINKQHKIRISEALDVLRQLGLPRQQQNERSALTLLALLDLKPSEPWSSAGSPLIGITPMMNYFAAHYFKKYAPNSRETVRRFTIHQFEQAGVVVKNPDLSRSINSPDNVYQIESESLELLRKYKTRYWAAALKVYFSRRKTLSAKYAAERSMRMIPVHFPDGTELKLSPEGQNVLVKEILLNFCPRFSPGGRVLYVGDTGDKLIAYERRALKELGIEIDEHGKMPDVIIHDVAKGWLLIIEAVTSHGPISPLRQLELKELFRKSTAGLVFVTAFLNRKSMIKDLSKIAWETEVWVAETPTHMIHLNGERFLGPYENS